MRPVPLRNSCTAAAVSRGTDDLFCMNEQKAIIAGIRWEISEDVPSLPRV